MKDKEAMAMALEALEYIDDGANNQGTHTGISWRCVSTKAEPAIAALKEALAQPQETTLKEFNQFIHDDPNYHIWAKKREAKVEGSLHVVCQCDKCKAHPPQRTWVGLTDEDIGDAYVAWDDTNGASFADFARAIEAKLKQKNGYAEENT